MKITTVLMAMVVLLSVSMANVSAKTEHELTEIENLKLINIDYKVKDLQNQYANFKRNLSVALKETQRSKNSIIKDIEKRLNIKPGEYEIKSNKIIMKSQPKKTAKPKIINEKISGIKTEVTAVDNNKSIEEENEIIFGPEEK